MGGGGSSGPFLRRTPKKLSELVRRSELQTAGEKFEIELSTVLTDLLASFNGRDTQLTKERLTEIKEKLEGRIEGTFDQLFGGSVAKHTYVDGLSDIDSLLIINDTALDRSKPAAILDRLADIITRRLGDAATVTHGRMAVTIEYQDDMKIQLLPAVRTDEGLRVPSSRTDGWSHIEPREFQAALTRRNEQCGGKLIPVIKMAKAINGTLPEEQRLSGYHVESLAIAAFRGYDGAKNAAAMLPAFYEKAKDLVLAPIADSTGQSVHVDDYLGPEKSDARLNASHLLGRIAKRMRNATAAASTAQWKALFEIDE